MIWIRGLKKTKNNIDWDKVYLLNYENKAFRDIHWLGKAKELIKTANLIEPILNQVWESVINNKRDCTKIEYNYYSGTYFMLIAFAFENIFKAMIIRNKLNYYKCMFRETNKFPKELQSHKLIELAKKSGFKYNFEQEDLLRRLTRSAIWFGRYPIPLSFRDSKSIELYEDGKKYKTDWFGSDDLNRVTRMIDHLKEYFKIDL